MDGCDPRSGERLRAAHGRTRVAALDLTFSAPKSVSVLFAIGDEELSGALVGAHERAVEAAVAYVEREACFTRRGRDGVRRVRSEGFVGAAHRHRLSRAGDPQLHTHVVVSNMTRVEGRWTSLEAHGIYEHKSAAGALYRAVLRAEVRERLPWVSWRAAGRGLFEIEGVPAGRLREFSRRRVEIEERALELAGVAAGELSRERLQGIALATRRAKEYRVDGARWRQEARARAAEHGLGEGDLARLRSGPKVIAARSEAQIVAAAAARWSGPDGLTANNNTFARRHVLAEVAGELAQGASVAELERVASAYLNHDTVVLLGGEGAERRYTTRDLLAAERAIIDGSRSRASERTAVLDAGRVDRTLSRLPVEPSVAQAAAVRALAGSGSGVEVVQALAGTGKTRLLGALAGCYRQSGYQVVGVAPTGRAARELSDAIKAPAHTLHRLLADLDRSGGFGPGNTVVLFDEAAMAPTRLSAALFAHAERTQTKVIAAGDGGQLPSVQAGGWFAAVVSQQDGPQLREVMRQRDPRECAALEALHDGDPDCYLAFKQRQRSVKVHSHERDALAALLAEWDQARSEHGLSEVVMIARENQTRQLLNQRARAILKLDHALAGDGVVIADREYCVGERVIARRNDHHRDIDNGTRGTVTAIDLATGALTIETDHGGRRALDATYTAEHLEHAYALTGHGAQGATVEWVGVTGRPGDFTAEWAYTALSRARGHTQLHVSAKPTAAHREREQHAPPEPVRTRNQTLQATHQALKRHASERLATEKIEPPRPATFDTSLTLPLGEITEAGAEPASSVTAGGTRAADAGVQTTPVERRTSGPPPPEPDWLAYARRRDALSRGRSLQR